MLTCEICAEEFLLEEDIRTHLLLCHVENQMACPLCCLSGVSYDELTFHINTAHPESHERAPTDVAGSGRGHFSSTEVVDGQSSCMDRSESCEGAAGKGGRCDAPVVSSLRASGRPATPVPLGATLANREGPAEGTVIMTETSREVATPDPVPPAQTSYSPNRAALTSSPQHWKENEEELKTGHSKAKQKRLSSPRKAEPFPCPMCARVFSDCLVLQQHVEMHLQETTLSAEASSQSVEESPSSSGGDSYECPLCSLVCDDGPSLQEHVELHLDGSTDAETGTDTTTDTTTDLRLARRIQEEEEEERKWQEADDFKKLQRQFGLAGGGGYLRQMERSMERAVSRGQMGAADFHAKRAEAMEALASGLDDGKTRTQGLVGALSVWFQREAGDGAQVWLSAETDHYGSSEGDRGWGCGYRNLQMILSSLGRTEPYQACLSGLGLSSAPSIPRVQGLIEGAWREGLDPQGASHFNQRLTGTRAWIGATEIYSLLTSLGVSGRIVDFHQPTGPGGSHPRLFEWVKEYFSQPASRGARLPPRVALTARPPLYLQHQGHSRCIVGLEQRKNGAQCLLLLDPGCGAADVRKLLSADPAAARAAVKRLRKFPGNMKHLQYQVVAVEGVLSPEDRQTRILNSRTLCAERIP